MGKVKDFQGKIYNNFIESKFLVGKDFITGFSGSFHERNDI